MAAYHFPYFCIFHPPFRRPNLCTQVTISDILDLANDVATLMQESPDREAKLGLLQYLLVNKVNDYEEAYDGLFYELQRSQNFAPLREIEPKTPKELLQENASSLIEDHLREAVGAQLVLEQLAADACKDVADCEVISTGVKEASSIQRKADKACEGRFQPIVDMARITVVCTDPVALAMAFHRLGERIQVRTLGLCVSKKYSLRCAESNFPRPTPSVEAHCSIVHMFTTLRFVSSQCPIHFLGGGQSASYQWFPAGLYAQRLP